MKDFLLFSFASVWTEDKKSAMTRLLCEETRVRVLFKCLKDAISWLFSDEVTITVIGDNGLAEKRYESQMSVG